MINSLFVICILTATVGPSAIACAQPSATGDNGDRADNGNTGDTGDRDDKDDRAAATTAVDERPQRPADDATPRLVFPDLPSSEQAPHRQGNIYAADIVRWNDEWLMYYGGQGRDGHDRIHLATSTTGADWTRQGVVFSPPGVNHVNDASVVSAGDRLLMFYTRANQGVTDTIGLAVSHDGRQWEDRGSVLAPADGQWDALLVGRPSVLFENGRFRMWYDGRKDLPPRSPDPQAPKSHKSRRYVGYAESTDGVVWQRHSAYVLGGNAGGVHVSRQAGRLVMLIESRAGTQWACSTDGLHWQSRGMLLDREGSAPFGHVTPFLFAHDGRLDVIFGAARSTHWDRNILMVAPVSLPVDAVR